ncbi:hypothetical protein [Methylovirgula sp. 4M-Z18]|uniref:hypothetical protein n=1 Tax=Methylovirgula sp. 4M-Z18 TaxID=2293567 RepID=UPI000E2EB38D|nr:hypothetical protein [Methylovirgula sp. 4M-Z18]RFB78493.1 hypothetical protein DYH55_14795 [Methylovirgula sp. 4M-Z18]
MREAKTGAKRIISFSLYGSHRLYCEGALHNLELSQKHYAGWVCRYYVDGTVPDRYVRSLSEGGAEVVPVTTASKGPMYGRYWRFLVAAEADVERFIVRDTDSRLNPRERSAVDAWIASGQPFHLMRDSAHHRSAALGGMWGALGGSFPDIAELIDGWGRYDQWGQNDQFVSTILFPRMQGNYLCHDEAGYFDDGHPFPAHPALDGTSFVGEKVDVDGAPIDIWRRAGQLENLRVRETDRAERLQRDLSEARSTIDALNADRAQLASLRDHAIAEKDRMTAERNRAAQERDHIAQERDRTAQERDHAARERDTLSVNYERMLRTERELRKQIADIYNSTSWKTTRPFRYLSRLFHPKRPA